jgi:hypothetical protein
LIDPDRVLYILAPDQKADPGDPEKNSIVATLGCVSPAPMQVDINQSAGSGLTTQTAADR